jgi:hypothetical protein
MRPFILSLIFSLVFLSFTITAWAAGLGSTFLEFEREWNRGYRQEYKMMDSAKRIHVGKNSDQCVIYDTGLHDFNGRVGAIWANARGIFGASPGQSATRKQFMTSIRSMMPADSKLLAKYSSRKPGYLNEIYVFKSENLKKLKGIESAVSYTGEPRTVGQFFISVSYDPDDSNKVGCFSLNLGSGESDYWGMKKVKASW